MSADRRRWHPARWLPVLTVALAFVALVRYIGVPPGAPAFDQDACLWAGALVWPGGARTMEAASWLGTVWFLLPATLAVMIVLLVRGWRASAWLFGASVTGAWLLETSLKVVFERARPTLFPPLVVETGYSFPSGHATMVTVFFGTFAALVWRVTRRPRPRAATIVLAVLAIFVVSLSRMCLGVHWLTDVVGGVLVGLFWVVAAATAFGLAPAPSSPRR